jgi:hypothetical protein
VTHISRGIFTKRQRGFLVVGIGELAMQWVVVAARDAHTGGATMNEKTAVGVQVGGGGLWFVKHRAHAQIPPIEIG